MSARVPFWSPEAPEETAPLALPTVGNVKTDTAAGLYIGRPMPGRPDLKESGWANPVKLTKDTTEARHAAIRKFVIGLLERQQRASLPDLAGEHLLCWCHPKPCHGHALVQLVEATRFHRAPCPHCASPVVSFLNWHDDLGLREAWICTGPRCGRRGHRPRPTPPCLAKTELDI